jgi:hypothetical protein
MNFISVLGKIHLTLQDIIPHIVLKRSANPPATL